MFTNNFVKLMKLVFLNNTYGRTESFKCANGETFNGYNQWLCYAGLGELAKNGKCTTLNPYTSSSSYTSVSSGLFFGSGSTPATKDDYTLESIITSGLSISNGGRVYENVEDGIHSYYFTFSVRNTSGSDINIYEMGVYAPMSSSNSTSGINLTTTPWYSVLLERTVLTEPITIAPGQTKIITYKITFNQTLNVD